jgi:hypothetical protein
MPPNRVRLGCNPPSAPVLHSTPRRYAGWMASNLADRWSCNQLICNKIALYGLHPFVSCRPTVRLRLLLTPSRDDAITFGYGVVAFSDTDFHRADRAPSWAHEAACCYCGRQGFPTPGTRSRARSCLGLVAAGRLHFPRIVSLLRSSRGEVSDVNDSLSGRKAPINRRAVRANCTSLCSYE